MSLKDHVDREKLHELLDHLIDYATETSIDRYQEAYKEFRNTWETFNKITNALMNQKSIQDKTLQTIYKLRENEQLREDAAET